MRTTLGKELAPWNSCSSIVRAYDGCCWGHWFDFYLGLRIYLSCLSACCCATDRLHYVIVWRELEGNNIRPTGFTIDKETLGNCFDIWWLCRTYPRLNCLHKLELILLSNYLIYVLRMVTCCIRSCLSVTFQVRVVLTTTVVVVDRCFDNLNGRHPT